MASDSEILIRDAYEAYARGDVSALLDTVDPDFEWTYLDPSQPEPIPQTCHGRKELEQGLRRQTSRGLRSHIEEVIGRGDKVLVTIRTPGVDQFRARPTGDVNFDVVTVSEGRIVALRACRDRSEALELLGMPTGGQPV